jgi:hypothetical protein
VKLAQQIQGVSPPFFQFQIFDFRFQTVRKSEI